MAGLTRRAFAKLFHHGTRRDAIALTPLAPVSPGDRPGQPILLNVADLARSFGSLSVLRDITLTVERRLEYASVRISDAGIGIAAEMLPCVFGLFVQVEPSAPHSEAGRGIGLAVVRSLVEIHGGVVTAASDGLGRGSEFTVLLPALKT